MSARVKLGVVCSSMLLTILLVVGAVIGRGEEADDSYRPLAVYTEVLARIKSDYVEEPDIDQVTQGALQGLVEYLDPMSSYLSEQQLSEYRKAVANPDEGTGLSTGMVVHKRGNYTVVLNVLPDSPAARAGIEAGDFIEAIDDHGTRMMPPAYLYSKLSGAPGSPIKLLIRSSGNYDEPEEHRLVRDKISYPDVERETLEGGVGRIGVTFLNKNTTAQVEKAVKALEKAGATKLILDLRGNALGSVDVGIELADLFVSEGRLTLLKGQRVAEKTFEASAKATVTELPLVVLTDRFVSGGAEVAALALKETGRAKVVGERTYGLASEQELVTLDDGAALILSTAKYYRADGDALQDNGVAPEYGVAPADLRRWRNPEEGEDRGEDPFLRKALDVFAGTAEPTPQDDAA